MLYNNELTKMIEKAENGKGIFTGNVMDPKRNSELVGPLHMINYVQNKMSSIDVIKTMYRRKSVVENNEFNFLMSDATKNEVIKHCRVTEEVLTLVGFKSAKKLSDINGNFVIEIETKYGKVKPLTFRDERSNVAVFMNSEGVTSFVADGRCRIIDHKVYLISTNQVAMQNFVDAKIQDPDSRISLDRMLSKEFWQLEDKDKKNKIDNEEIIKAIMWLGYTKYCDFPDYNGEFYNVIWSADDKGLYEICKEDESLKQFINYSSLAQTGFTAVCGPLKSGLCEYEEPILDFNGNPMLDKEGNVKTEKRIYLEAGDITPFKGINGKLDVMANQGNKRYKQSKNLGPVMVVLAEIRPKGYKYGLNTSGNCIATPQAACEYMSDMTMDKARECHMDKLPAHKIFIKSGGKPIRAKGATSIMKMYAIDENNLKENRIIVLPPREFNPDGSIEEDFKKFEHLCKYRDKGAWLGMVKLHFEDQVIEAPALYCDVYEDAMHSAVTSLKITPQNIFYYGALFFMYLMNGKQALRKAMVQMIDHKRISRAMNFARIGKSKLVEQDYVDFIDTL